MILHIPLFTLLLQLMINMFSPSLKTIDIDEHLRDNHSIEENDEDGVEHIAHYTESSAFINRHELDNKPYEKLSRYEKEAHKLSKNISDTIQKHAKPLTEPLNVYSGLTYNPTKQIENKIFKTPAFTSASIDYKTASAFSQLDTTDDNAHHIAHFKLPVGYKKGIYADPYSATSGEMEFLLDKGQKWKHIRSYSKINKNKLKTAIHTFTPVDE